MSLKNPTQTYLSVAIIYIQNLNYKQTLRAKTTPCLKTTIPKDLAIYNKTNFRE